jgi:hypothetical protein
VALGAFEAGRRTWDATNLVRDVAVLTDRARPPGLVLISEWQARRRAHPSEGPVVVSREQDPDALT